MSFMDGVKGGCESTRGFVYTVKKWEKENKEGVYLQTVHQHHMSQYIIFLSHRESGDSSPFSSYHHWELPVKMKEKKWLSFQQANLVILF